jgi:hypothetical protein
MLSYLEGRGNDRKLRLFAVACCRKVWHRLGDEGSRRAVECAGAFADERIGRSKLDQVRNVARPVIAETGEGHPANAAVQVGTFLAHRAALGAVENAHDEEPFEVKAGWMVPLLREVLGNPFRPVAIDAACLNTPVVSPAHKMYESRDFAPMPILADALEEAGCDNADVPVHCRGDGVHVRGCWVVDLVLGMS